MLLRSCSRWRSWGRGGGGGGCVSFTPFHPFSSLLLDSRGIYLLFFFFFSSSFTLPGCCLHKHSFRLFLKRVSVFLEVLCVVEDEMRWFPRNSSSSSSSSKQQQWRRVRNSCSFPVMTTTTFISAQSITEWWMDSSLRLNRWWMAQMNSPCRPFEASAKCIFVLFYDHDKPLSKYFANETRPIGVKVVLCVCVRVCVSIQR